MIVTIDGPAGSGKSTTAKLAAKRLGFQYIDTGATYRAVALAVSRNKIDPSDQTEVEKLSGILDIDLCGDKVFLNDEEITSYIRTEEIGRLASLCATYKGVRENMVKLQRKLAAEYSVVCEGRDIGTVVFPGAEAKFYMDASVETRAQRRQKELSEKGIKEDFQTTINSIKSRDEQDKGRKHSPLRIPDGAKIIDTTGLSIEEQVSEITHKVEHISRDLSEKKSQMNAKLFKQEYKEISYGFTQTNMDYKQKQGIKLRYRLGTIIICCLWKVLFGFRVKGRENIPDSGGVIIAPNHLSNFDPPLVGTAVWKRECFFLSKKDIFIINKFYSYIMEKFNAYPITIKKPTTSELKQIKNLVDKKLALVMFPEGTRSRVGHFVHFNEGVAWLALLCKAPIVPTLVANTNTSLVSQLIRKNRVVIKFGVPITVDFYSQFKDPHEARTKVTEELRHRIEQLVT